MRWLTELVIYIGTGLTYNHMYACMCSINFFFCFLRFKQASFALQRRCQNILSIFLLLTEMMLEDNCKTWRQNVYKNNYTYTCTY